MYILSFESAVQHVWMFKSVVAYYLVFGFFDAFWPVLAVDVAFFTHDNLVTLTLTLFVLARDPLKLGDPF